MVTGFSSPATGYEGTPIDLNQLLVKHPNATNFMKISSNKYIQLGIYAGDLLIIDRSQKPNPESIVVYEEDGHFVLGPLYNINHETIITGKIVSVIHQMAH